VPVGNTLARNAPPVSNPAIPIPANAAAPKVSPISKALTGRNRSSARKLPVM
jgi:hypothetical protein